MKKFISIFFLVSSFLFAQQNSYAPGNPDGENLSFHFTPFFAMAKSKLDENKLYESDSNFNYNLKVKIPLSNTLTFSLFYEKNSLEYDLINSKSKMIENLTKIGGTISFYVH